MNTYELTANYIGGDKPVERTYTFKGIGWIDAVTEARETLIEDFELPFDSFAEIEVTGRIVE